MNLHTVALTHLVAPNLALQVRTRSWRPGPGGCARPIAVAICRLVGRTVALTCHVMKTR